MVAALLRSGTGFTSMSPRRAHRKARAVRPRAGDHPPRASWYNFNCRKGFFTRNRAEAPVVGQAMGALRIAGRYKCAPDLPDVSKCFRKAVQKIHAGDRQATLHGVVFDILVGSENRLPSRRFLQRKWQATQCPSALRLRGGAALLHPV